MQAGRRTGRQLDRTCSVFLGSERVVAQPNGALHTPPKIFSLIPKMCMFYRTFSHPFGLHRFNIRNNKLNVIHYLTVKINETSKNETEVKNPICLNVQNKLNIFGV